MSYESDVQEMHEKACAMTSPAPTGGRTTVATPRTDAMWRVCEGKDQVSALSLVRHHARQLERELAEKQAESKARATALEFAKAAIDDAIYTEDGLDGDAGQRVLHIIEEALTLGTFDKVKYGELPESGLEAALTAERQRSHLFGELMAVIHGDGGHYLGEHGPQKAYDDALVKWYAERQRSEGLRAALLELRIRYHAAGRRPEECYEMSLIDAALAARTEK